MRSPSILMLGLNDALIRSKIGHISQLHPQRGFTALKSSSEFTDDVSTNIAIDNMGQSDVTQKRNLKGLRKETERQYLRCIKKITKANQRLEKARVGYENFMTIENPNEKEFEKCPNPKIVEEELLALKVRMADILDLQNKLNQIKEISTNNSACKVAMDLADKLEIGDTPPQKEVFKKKKKVGATSSPRKPYFVYTSTDGEEIRVGRRAEDNDELSCNPQFRDGADWWLHVAGHAGSHVVIRSHDDDLPVTKEETLKDAAVLAAVNSKGPQSGKSIVSYTRCRNVIKPMGAKPGLVRLTADVNTIKVDMKEEKERLDRLERTKQVNK